MKKFERIKQICTISLLALLLAVAITCLVLYWVNPQQLKATFEYAKTILDHPLPIIGVSVGVFCFTLLQIFSHTSFGKGIYTNAKKENEQTLAKAQELEKNAKDYYEKSEQLKNDTLSVLNDFSKSYEDLFKKLVKLCETSPNAKIKALGEDFKICCYANCEEMQEKLQDFGNQYKTKESETIVELVRQIDELREKFNKAEKDYEEGKE